MALWQVRSPRSYGPPAPAMLAAVRAPEQRFHGWTEDRFIDGVVPGSERLSDLLNRRSPITLREPRMASADAIDWCVPVGDSLAVDPFDFDVVLAGPLPEIDEVIRRARRVHKVAYPVAIQCRQFSIEGLVHLFPGLAPEYAAMRGPALFLPVTRPVVRWRGRTVSEAGDDVALVNRYGVVDVRQIDSLAS